MRQTILLLLTILMLQLKSQDIKYSNSFDDNDETDAFTLLGIRNFKFEMPVVFKGYYFDFIIKEYFDGVEISSLSQSTRFAEMKHVLQWRTEFDGYTMKIQSLKNDTVETFNVRLPGVGLRGLKLKLKLKRNEYAWMPLINEKTKLIENTEIPILTFSSDPSNPSRPNTAVHCELPDYNYKDWYTKLKARHFFVMLIKVTKN